MHGVRKRRIRSILMCQQFQLLTRINCLIRNSQSYALNVTRFATTFALQLSFDPILSSNLQSRANLTRSRENHARGATARYFALHLYVPFLGTLFYQPPIITPRSIQSSVALTSHCSHATVASRGSPSHIWHCSREFRDS